METKNRVASFVSLESENRERFKYNGIYLILKRCKKYILPIKRILNSSLQNVQLKMSFIDWKTAKTTSIVWIVEAAIEGLLINFATHHLFGFKFNPWTTISYGILVKESIEIYKRLKNGTNSILTEKDK